MDQATQAGIERYKAAVERVRSGESDSEEVELPSGRVRLTPDEAAPTGIRIEVLEGDQSGTASCQADPEKQEAMKRMEDVIGRFRAGDLDTAEIPVPSGETMQLTRDDRSPGAFTVRSPDGGPTMRTVPFDPSSTRQEGYPEDMPFLAETAVVLTEIEGQSFRTFTWFKVQDPEECLRALRLQLVTHGWEEKDESKVSTARGTMTSIEFGMGELRRTVTLHRFGEHGVVKLLEHPKKEIGDRDRKDPDLNAR